MRLRWMSISSGAGELEHVEIVRAGRPREEQQNLRHDAVRDYRDGHRRAEPGRSRGLNPGGVFLGRMAQVGTPNGAAGGPSPAGGAAALGKPRTGHGPRKRLKAAAWPHPLRGPCEVLPVGQPHLAIVPPRRGADERQSLRASLVDAGRSPDPHRQVLEQHRLAFQSLVHGDVADDPDEERHPSVAGFNA